ncbi:unnamed protein product [Spodoptera exigua]|nr:unnamed protein product [Spodoptera exigua]
MFTQRAVARRMQRFRYNNVRQSAIVKAAGNDKSVTCPTPADGARSLTLTSSINNLASIIPERSTKARVNADNVPTTKHHRVNEKKENAVKLSVKIWFQNHRYKCKRQAKEKAMAEQNQHNQVCSKITSNLFTYFKKLRYSAPDQCKAFFGSSTVTLARAWNIGSICAVGAVAPTFHCSLGAARPSNDLLSFIVIAPTSGSSRPSEGRETLWLWGVVVTSAQPLRHPDVRVLRPAALAGRVQQPARVVVPPARGLPAAVLRVPAAAGPRLVEVPTALS